MAGATDRLLNDSGARVSRVRVPGPPPLLTPEKAYKLAIRVFQDNGFLTVRKSKASIYLKKAKCTHLVRLSDHKSVINDLSKVSHDLVFDYSTIKPDVVSRCQSVIKIYR